jgi:hypothetical protein
MQLERFHCESGKRVFPSSSPSQLSVTSVLFFFVGVRAHFQLPGCLKSMEEGKKREAVFDSVSLALEDVSCNLHVDDAQ